MSNASSSVRRRQNGFNGGWANAGAATRRERAYVEPIADGRKSRVRMMKITLATWGRRLKAINASLKYGASPVREMKDMSVEEIQAIKDRYGMK